MSLSSVAAERLRAIIERIERLEQERDAISDDIFKIYAEAKANGFDTRILWQVMRSRKKDASERRKEEVTRALYLQALGMLPDLEEGK